METQLYQIQSQYQKAILFAARKHKDQKIPGTDLPYLVHLSNVAMEILSAVRGSREFDVEFATTLALLHDTLEDTDTTYEELTKEFGQRIADAVTALTKESKHDKDSRMMKSIEAIRKMPREVWMVKMADRITNLQKPPAHWNKEKIFRYWKDAVDLHNHLFTSNDYISIRLLHETHEYRKYFEITDADHDIDIPPSQNSM